MDNCVHRRLQKTKLSYTIIRLNMLERRRLIISMIFALNMCFVFWRMTWKDVNNATSLEPKRFPDNASISTHEQPPPPPQHQQQQQQRKINMYESLFRSDGNISQATILKFPNVNYDISQSHSHAMSAVSTTPSPTDDQHRLIDLFDFSYKLQVATCSRHIVALIMVHSAPENHQKRKLIRETWASRDLLRLAPLRVLFLFGSVEDETLQQQLLKEHQKYADMVQGSFRDDYRNLTYKHVMAFKWFLDKCTYAQLLIKVDDDILLNTPQLLKYARGMNFSRGEKYANDTMERESSPKVWTIQALFNQPRALLFCERNNKSKVKRTYRSKWHVSFKEYKNEYYPPYCLGYAIVYSSDVVARLYASAQQEKYFWIDDVHITGILAQLNGITITDFSKYLLSDKASKELMDYPVIKHELEFLFTTHGIDRQRMQALWKLISKSSQSTAFAVPSEKAKTKNSYRRILSKRREYVQHVELKTINSETGVSLSNHFDVPR